MARRAARFTEADVLRAAKAAQVAGLTIAKIEVDGLTGKIAIFTPAGIATENPAPTDADDIFAAWEAGNASKAQGIKSC